MEQPDTVVQDSAVDTAADSAPEAQEEVTIDEELLEGEQQAEPDESEEEVEGVKLKGKKADVERLRNERLMQADYTRKMQALKAEKEAEQASIKAEKEAVEKRGQLYNAHLTLVGDLVATDKQLEAYKGLDWNALTDSDPVRALKLDREYRNLVEHKQQGLAKLAQLQHQNALDEQRKAAEADQATAKQIERAAAVLKREVPNWSATRDTELREYAIREGLPSDGLRELIVKAPSLGKILHKAELYDQLVAKQVQRKAPEVQEAPVTRITASRTPGTRDPRAMSDAEFAAWRKRQIAQRR